MDQSPFARAPPRDHFGERELFQYVGIRIEPSRNFSRNALTLNISGLRRENCLQLLCLHLAKKSRLPLDEG